MKWCRKAAEQGNPQAQMNLGALLLNGQGVERNAVKGLIWIQKAAEQGMSPQRRF